MARNRFRPCIAALVAVLAAGCGRPSPEETADAIYAGGAIVTLDDAQPGAEAVAVKDGRILAVGARAELEHAHEGDATRTVDLNGRVLLPGFVDAHGHLVNVGVQSAAANLLPPPDGEVASIAALEAQLAAYADTDSPLRALGLILGTGYDDAQLAERRHPTRDDLDRVSREVPVIAVHQSGHLGAVNSVVLEKLGWSAATPDPPGGVIRRRADGEPDGVLEESAIFAVLFPIIQGLTPEQNVALVELGQQAYAKFGFTTAQEGRALPAQVAALAAAAEQGRLVIDVVAYPDVFAAAEAIDGPWAGPTYRNHFRIGGGKISLDGSPQGKTAWLTEPYFHPPPGQPDTYAGYAAIPDDAVVTAKVLDAYARDLQILAHVNGDAASDQLIGAVAAAVEEYGRKDLRPVAIHAQVLREDQLDAFAVLGIVPSFFPLHTFYWGDWHRDETLGPERAAHISPARSALDRGLAFTAHHDAPVGLPSSIMILASLVNRTTRSGQVLGPEQRIGPLDALRAITLNAARQYHEEQSKGSIEPGKLADFVILDRNPLTVEPGELWSLRVLETIKEGKTVYAAP